MKLTREKIIEIADKIKQTPNVVRIVLFGSWAWGTPNENSDIDILVVEKEYDDKISELVRMKNNLISSEYSIDILLYTQKEYEEKLSQGWSLLERIEKKGKLLYAA